MCFFPNLSTSNTYKTRLQTAVPSCTFGAALEFTPRRPLTHARGLPIPRRHTSVFLTESRDSLHAWLPSLAPSLRLPSAQQRGNILSLRTRSFSWRLAPRETKRSHDGPAICCPSRPASPSRPAHICANDTGSSSVLCNPNAQNPLACPGTNVDTRSTICHAPLHSHTLQPARAVTRHQR